MNRDGRVRDVRGRGFVGMEMMEMWRVLLLLVNSLVGGTGSDTEVEMVIERVDVWFVCVWGL